MIEFQVIWANRKSLEIAVHPDCAVIVTAPKSADVSAIDLKVRKRARWIFKQIKYFSQFTPKTPPRNYIPGETHLYLGRQYRLKTIIGDYEFVKLIRGKFIVSLRKANTTERTKELLQQWYSDKAVVQLGNSFERCWSIFNGLGLSKPIFVIRPMKKRWGSLSNNGRLTLNPDLVRAPKECIDYVVIHELCHLKHHDHGPDFYKLLESVIPDWEKIKHRLELSMA